MKHIPIIYHPHCLQHLTGSMHPESPFRIAAIIQALKDKQLLRADNLIIPHAASMTEILLCHQKSYLDTVIAEINTLIQQAPDTTVSLSTGDVQISARSFDAAQLALGGALAAVDIVLSGQSKAAFACIRPPGHHATTDKGMGFCLFNNIAIAARYAQHKYQLKKVAIIDWDVHHGNGTQDIFYHDPSVFYFSTHQAGIYPGTGHSDEAGVGNIVNCPILPSNTARNEVITAFKECMLPAINKFQPELILISAGFDAHHLDPLGGLNLLTEDFAALTRLVMDIANEHCEGRIVSLLEGGYNLSALADSVCAHINTLSRGS